MKYADKIKRKVEHDVTVRSWHLQHRKDRMHVVVDVGEDTWDVLVIDLTSGTYRRAVALDGGIGLSVDKYGRIMPGPDY